MGGGYTNTEDAITKCTTELEGSDNPVMVIITDGTPTACRHNSGYNTEKDTINYECSNLGSYDLDKKNFQRVAYHQADKAADKGITIVPVIINSVSSNVNILEKLARCPENTSWRNKYTCGDKYKDLEVGDIDELELILDNLVKSTGCEQ